MTKKKKTGSGLKAGLIGAGLGAAAAWFLYATETGKEKREEIVALADRIKDEVVDEAKKLKEDNEPSIHAAIDTVVAKYKSAKNVDPAVLGKIVSDLKTRWNEVKNQFDGKDDAGEVIAKVTKAVKAVKKDSGEKSA